MFHKQSYYDSNLSIKKLRKNFNKNDTGVNEKNMEKCISFNVKVKIMLAGVNNKDCKEVHKNIQLKFTDSWIFMASSWGKLASNLDDEKCKNLRHS